MRRNIVIVTALAAMATGCIIGETSHRIYIDPGGGVEWVVLERELRSNADGEDRRAEERGLLDRVASGDHPVLRAFELLGGRDTTSVLLRERRPYSVWTEARFEAADELARELMLWLGVRGEATLDTVAGVTRLEVRVDPGEDGEVLDEAILALVSDLASYRLVLTDGCFVEAVGFDLEEEGTVAVPRAPEEAGEGGDDGPILLALAWTVDRPVS